MINLETGLTTQMGQTTWQLSRVGKPKRARLGRLDDPNKSDQHDDPYGSIMPVKFFDPA